MYLSVYLECRGGETVAVKARRTRLPPIVVITMPITKARTANPTFSLCVVLALSKSRQRSILMTDRFRITTHGTSLRRQSISLMEDSMAVNTVCT